MRVAGFLSPTFYIYDSVFTVYKSKIELSALFLLHALPNAMVLYRIKVTLMR